MQKIYSKKNPELLLHIINRKKDITRTRWSPPDEFLQVACFSLPKNKTFKAHYHIPSERRTTITQESMVVIQGKLKAILYDIDNEIIAEPILEAGDCSITFRGGHNFLALEDDTLVYEFKTGPYLGQKKDKKFI